MVASSARYAKLFLVVLFSVPVAAQLNGMIYTNAPEMSAAPQPWRATDHQLAQGRRLSLTTAQQQAILDKHNTLRAGVNKPCTAADMETMVWDTTLASASLDYAGKCVWQHDDTNDNNGWGENLAMSSRSDGNHPQITASTLTGFVQSWYSEVEDTVWTADGTGATSKTVSNPQTECKSPNAKGACMIGHYTQVVWAKSNKVGCGAVVCNNGLMGVGGLYLVCKYTPAGNLAMGSGATSAPWMVGKPCAACAGSCSNGHLCDVGSNPNRCKDTITTMVFNNVEHTDCASLIAATEKFGTNYWCTNGDREPKLKICQLTCNVCTVPPNVGLSACSDHTTPQHSTTHHTTPQSTTAKYALVSDATHGWRIGTAFIVLLYRFTLCD